MQFIQQYQFFYWGVSLWSFKDVHILVQHNPKQSNNSSFISPSTGIIHLTLAIFLKEQVRFLVAEVTSNLLFLTLVKSNFEVHYDITENSLFEIAK